jgi:hypothetical protein
MSWAEFAAYLSIVLSLFGSAVWVSYRALWR